MLLLAYAVPTIVMVMMIAATPQAECAMEEGMVIQVGIVAVNKVYTVVGSAICVIACGNTEVEVITVTIAVPYAHAPRIPYHIYRTIEIVALHKPTVLAATEHIHEVLITHIEQIVVVVDCIIVSIYHVVYHLVHLIQEVKVDFIHVIVLTVRESQLMSHTVSKEACLTTHVGQVHRGITLCANSCQSHKHHSQFHRFHSLTFLE